MSISRALTFVSFVAATAFCVAMAPAASANGILISSRPGVTPPMHPPHRPFRRPRPLVTLEGHKVDATIDGRVASVTVEQVFRNHSGRQLEGTYLFPLPEGASVSQWSMTMFGKMVRGEIMEAKKARQIYQDIVSRRRDPGLLEYMGRGLFRARVFPIEPNKTTTIRLTFQQVLPEDAGTMEFRYPLATEKMNANPVKSAVVNINVQSDVPLTAIYSPSHNIDVKKDGDKKAIVSYERGNRRQARDLVVYFTKSRDAVGFSMQSTKGVGTDGTFMAVLAPKTDVAVGDLVPKDVVYVLDTSGSMAGKKMDQAQKALAYGVSLLRPEDRFNVLTFSVEARPWVDGLQPANKETKDAATQWIRERRAAGGTNIDDALSKALAFRSGDRLFMVVFITDGRPTVGEVKTEALVKKVKSQNTSNTRVFTFGVGHDLDVALLDKIAEATRAARDYVQPNEDIEIVTGRFFRKVEQPVLTDVRIAFGGDTRDVYPKVMPDFFAGSQLTVFGRYTKPGTRTVRVRGRIGKREITYEYQTELQSDGKRGKYLPRLWAHRKVAYMLDEIRLNGENKELVDEIIRLAKKHAIVTPYTAGLVVEESELATLADDRASGGRSAPRPRVGLGGGSGRGGFNAPAAAAPSTPSADGPARAEAGKKAKDSKRIDRLRKSAAEEVDEEEGEDRDGLRRVRERVRHAAGKSFTYDAKGRWVDTTYLQGTWPKDHKPTKIEAFSKAYFDLLAKGEDIAKILAIGERIVFVYDGVVYDVAPAKTK